MPLIVPFSCSFFWFNFKVPAGSTTDFIFCLSYSAPWEKRCLSHRTLKLAYYYHFREFKCDLRLDSSFKQKIPKRGDYYSLFEFGNLHKYQSQVFLLLWWLTLCVPGLWVFHCSIPKVWDTVGILEKPSKDRNILCASSELYWYGIYNFHKNYLFIPSLLDLKFDENSSEHSF